jgi:hypothetical protein
MAAGTLSLSHSLFCFTLIFTQLKLESNYITNPPKQEKERNKFGKDLVCFV